MAQDLHEAYADDVLADMGLAHYHLGLFEAGDDVADLPAAQVRLLERLCAPASPGPGDVVVDLGCGPGVTAAWLVGRGCHVVAVDLVAPMAERARAALAADAGGGGPARAVVRADMAVLPLADGSVDHVVAVESLYHHPHRARVLAEVRRILRPGGWLVVAEHALASPRRGPDRWWIRELTVGDHHGTVDDLRAGLVAAGFASVAVDDVTAAVVRPSVRAIRRDPTARRGVARYLARHHGRAAGRAAPVLVALIAAATTLSFTRGVGRYALQAARRPA
jgi:SAM-dependent methyltransferase